MEKLFASQALVAVVAPVLATNQTVPLSIPGMTCAACPITVKKAISKVEGVSKTDVSFDKYEAIVTFDDAKTSVQKLTKANEDRRFSRYLSRQPSNYAALFSTCCSRSGFSITVPIGSQFRVRPDQRSGFFSRACSYSS